jgi:hypothetical protein
MENYYLSNIILLFVTFYRDVILNIEPNLSTVFLLLTLQIWIISDKNNEKK